jgi:hypothetical protein
MLGWRAVAAAVVHEDDAPVHVGNLLAEDPGDLVVERAEVALLVEDGHDELDRAGAGRLCHTAMVD